MPLKSFIEVPQRDGRGNVILGPDGKPVVGIAINPVKQHIRAHWLAPDTVAIVLAVSAGVNQAGVRSQLRFTIDSQGHFDWASISAISTGIFSVSFFDVGANRFLMNEPVLNQLIAGSGVRPFRLPEPYFFNVGEGQRQLIAYLRDLSGAANTVRMVLPGRRFYHHEAPSDVGRDIISALGEGWRTYAFFLVPRETNSDGTIAAVAANGTGVFTFESEDGVETEIHKLMAYSTGGFTFTIREEHTNRWLMDDAVINTNGWGNAEFPFVFPDTYLMERKKRLIVNVTDISGSENRIYLAMACRRLQVLP